MYRCINLCHNSYIYIYAYTYVRCYHDVKIDAIIASLQTNSALGVGRQSTRRLQTVKAKATYDVMFVPDWFSTSSRSSL